MAIAKHTRDEIVRDMRFLAAHGRGPAQIRSDLRDWAQALDTADQGAYPLAVAKQGIANLICIANANAAFRRSVAPPFHRGPVALDVEDTGGYFLARALVASLVQSLPLNSAERLEMARHALAVEDRYTREMERLLPIP